MKKQALFLIVMLSLPTLAAAKQAEPFTASELHAMCTSTSDLDFGYCAGYMSAIAGMLGTHDINGARACNHGQVRSQQLVDTFNSYFDLFPEQAQAPASDIAAASLARAFPCTQ